MKRVIEVLIVVVAVLSLLALYLSGLGYRSGTLELGQAFTLMRWSAIAGVSGAILIVAYLVWRRPGGVRLLVLLVAAIMGLTAFYMPYRQSQIAQSVPPIHDITTDTTNPPVFVDVVPLRENAPNPPAYPGEETARQQQEAYPDLMTLSYQADYERVFEAVNAVVEEMGWEPVAIAEEEGRIEATATTRWFGFRDDVVIRVEDASSRGVQVDIRSKSRVGRSDVGANAARIRDFTERLNERLED